MNFLGDFKVLNANVRDIEDLLRTLRIKLK